MRPARKPHHDPARCRAGGCRRLLRLAERGAGRDAPPDTLENIARYLKEDLCIGGWDGGRLGAYFILRYCGQDAHNYAAFMGIPREEWDGWANADSAIVHPDYRGNGLQRKLLEVALTLLRPGIVGIGATVSPENQYSLNNALASGFEIVCRREMYGGYDRYLLAKALSVTFGDTYPEGRGTGVSVKPMLDE